MSSAACRETQRSADELDEIVAEANPKMKKKMELLQSALIHVHDIPEANIAELLKYIMSIDLLPSYKSCLPQNAPS